MSYLTQPNRTDTVYEKGLKIKQPTVGARYSRATFYCAPNSNSALSMNGKQSHQDFQMEFCNVMGRYKTDGAIHRSNKWGARLFNIRSGLFYRCWWEAYKEHGIYADLWPDKGKVIEFLQNTFYGCGAQGMQLEDRVTPKASDVVGGGTVRLVECWFRENGHPEGIGRSSFAMTNYMDANKAYTEYHRCKWTRMAKGPSEKQHTRALMLRNVYGALLWRGGIRYGAPDKPVVHIINSPVDEILFVEMGFPPHSVIRLNAGVTGVKFRGCRGTGVTIQHGTKKGIALKSDPTF